MTQRSTGTDTAEMKTMALNNGDHYVVNGQKVRISRMQQSDGVISRARSTPMANVKKRSEAMSILTVHLRAQALLAAQRDIAP